MNLFSKYPVSNGSRVGRMSDLSDFARDFEESEEDIRRYVESGIDSTRQSAWNLSPWSASDPIRRRQLRLGAGLGLAAVAMFLGGYYLAQRHSNFGNGSRLARLAQRAPRWARRFL